MSVPKNLLNKRDISESASRICMLFLFSVIACFGPRTTEAQTTTAQPTDKIVAKVPDWGPPVMDNTIFIHILFDQLEGRTNGPDNELRWDGEAWVGTDSNKLWLKSEGFAENGKVGDGDNEALYDRPIPRMRYFDAQAGAREDLDSGPRRAWGAVGIEGLAPYFFQFAPTFYFRDGGNVAGRLTGSYDWMIAQRLIAQPEAELNFYSKDDPARKLGSGFSDLDAGVRLRYEIDRKFGPYVGFAYNGKYGGSADYARQSKETVSDPRFIFGLRIWY